MGYIGNHLFSFLLSFIELLFGENKLCQPQCGPYPLTILVII